MAKKCLPEHIAIIIDGTFDLARSNELFERCKSLGIGHLTVCTPDPQKPSAALLSKEGIAVASSGREEVACATVLILRELAEGTLELEGVVPEAIQSRLNTTLVDLIIFTGGFKNLGGCCLWQAAYAEFVFLKKPWKAFETTDLDEAIAAFQDRNRRYGGLKK